MRTLRTHAHEHSDHRSTTIPTAVDKKNKNGFVQIIVIIVAALIFLRLIGVHILDILNQQWFKDFAHDTKEMAVLVWEDIVNIFNFFRGL